MAHEKQFDKICREAFHSMRLILALLVLLFAFTCYLAVHRLAEYHHYTQMEARV